MSDPALSGDGLTTEELAAALDQIDALYLVEVVAILALREATWRSEAACRGLDPALFYAERGDTDVLEEARAVCAGCPVREECLTAGMRERWGVWGGLAVRERERLRRAAKRPPDGQEGPSTDGPGSSPQAILPVAASAS